MGQAMLLLDRRARWSRTGTLSIGQLTAFVLYLNSFFQPIQQLVQQYNLYQQGQAAIVKLNDLLSTHPTVEEAPTPVPLPPHRGRRRAHRRVVRVRPGGARPARRQPAHRGRARRCRSWADRRRQVDHRQARDPLLRPDRGPRPDRRARPARRRPSNRCGASSASCPRSRTCSPARSATTSRSPGRTPPTPRSWRPSSGSA